MSSPLREHGVYRFHGRRYVAVLLATEGRPWQSTALLSLPFLAEAPQELLYLRHGDGLVLDHRDFGPVGRIDELEDTGETEELDALGRQI